MQPAAPVPPAERIEALDILRGAALFGILAANFRGFFHPFAAYFNPGLLPYGLTDRLAQAFVDTFIQGKFITIFATLFGAGFAIQFARAEARATGFRFFARRMAGLLLIGLVHSFLIWWGDILANYALLGFVLMLFRRCRPIVLLRWAGCLYVIPALAYYGYWYAIAHGHTTAPPVTSASELAAITQTYAHGPYAALFVSRARDWMHVNMFFVLMSCSVLPLFLAGAAIVRSGFFSDLSARSAQLARLQRWGFAIGLPATLAATVIDWLYHPNPMAPGLAATTVMDLRTLSQPALSLAYSVTVLRLMLAPAWYGILAPFAAVGRMALTNYLLQSLVLTTVASFYGLRLYGQGGPALYLVATVAFFALQVPLSRWWLARYAYGPVEWLWRRLTYGRPG